MTLPTSFIRQGFLSPEQARQGGRKFRRLMIGTDGATDTGKTEFALSCPGPGIVICLDRGFDGVFDNPAPPASRRDDFAFKVTQQPLATQAAQTDFLEYWKQFYSIFKEALANPDARTVVIDGDSDSWELQRLAEFGKLSQIPPIMYTNVNAARRAMYARAWDSGKIVIATNKISREYKTIKNADGTPKLNEKSGQEIREWDGKSFKRQGFEDQEYLWQIQLRHLYREAKAGPEWGIKITKCKADKSLIGLELWGTDCCFTGLVSAVYPHIDLAEWGL